MTALAQAISRISTATSKFDTSWMVVTIFSLAGLVISMLCLNLGIDFTQPFVGP